MNSASYPEKALPMTPSTCLVPRVSAEVSSKQREIRFLLASSEMADYFTEQSLLFPLWKMGGPGGRGCCLRSRGSGTRNSKGEAGSQR